MLPSSHQSPLLLGEPAATPLAPGHAAVPHFWGQQPSLSESDVRTTTKAALVKWRKRYLEERKKEIEKGKTGLGRPDANPFASAMFTPEDNFYRAWAASLDSSLGFFYQDLSLILAQKRFTVHTDLSGVIYPGQLAAIETVLHQYDEKQRSPAIKDYEFVASHRTGAAEPRTMTVDKILESKTPDGRPWFWIYEEKAGGDLDKNKSAAVKREMLTAYCILSNQGRGIHITPGLATAYNKDASATRDASKTMPWKQANVQRRFSEEELVIGPSWWNFLVGSLSGQSWILDELSREAKHTGRMRKTLFKIWSQKRERRTPAVPRTPTSRRLLDPNQLPLVLG